MPDAVLIDREAAAKKAYETVSEILAPDADDSVLVETEPNHLVSLLTRGGAERLSLLRSPGKRMSRGTDPGPGEDRQPPLGGPTSGATEPVWRYSKNPVIPRDLIPSSNSIFNSAVVPFKGELRRRLPLRRPDPPDAVMHRGFSADGIELEARSASRSSSNATSRRSPSSSTATTRASSGSRTATT